MMTEEQTIALNERQKSPELRAQEWKEIQERLNTAVELVNSLSIRLKETARTDKMHKCNQALHLLWEIQ